MISFYNNNYIFTESHNYIGKDLFENRVSTFCTSLHKFKPDDGVLYGNFYNDY